MTLINWCERIDCENNIDQEGSCECDGVIITKNGCDCYCKREPKHEPTPDKIHGMVRE